MIPKRLTLPSLCLLIQLKCNRDRAIVYGAAYVGPNTRQQVLLMKRQTLVNMTRYCLKRLMELAYRQYCANKYLHSPPPGSNIGKEAMDEADSALSDMDDDVVLSWAEDLFDEKSTKKLTYEEDSSGQCWFCLEEKQQGD